MAMTPFGSWEPDKATYQNPGVTVAKNVLPRTANQQSGATTYGPLAGLATVGNAMANKPQGAAAFRDSDGNVYTFGGDAGDLYKYNTTTGDWDEISKSTGAYTVAAEDAVEFAQYGERVISVNGITDTPQSYVMGTSSDFADLGGTPPRAKHIAVIKNFVMVGNTWDAIDEAKNNRVWWCANDDPTDWPTIASADAAAKQSDRQDLPTGGAVQAIVGAVGGLDGAIFSETAIRRIQYEGPPTVFGFYVVEEARGTPAPNSVVNEGNRVFYWGEDGAYMFDGANSIPIGDQRVDKYFYADLDQTYFHHVFGVTDAINKLVIWAYPGSGASNGVPNKLLIYNWAINRWSFGEVDLTLLFKDLTASYTMEGLDAVSSSLDALPFSLDSRIWTQGRLLLSALSTDFKLARFAGSALAATIETAETGGPGLTTVNGFRPVVDGGTVTVGIKHRLLPTASQTLVGPNAIDANGQANFVVTDRYFSGQVVVAAGGTWTHAQGGEYDAADGGSV